MINSGGDVSHGLDGGLEVPRPNIPFTLSLRLSLLACLFIVLAAGRKIDTVRARTKAGTINKKNNHHQMTPTPL